ncbi:MAG TPA: CHAD domain-containing protein [Chloroflexota bacterium]|nr:CHAD domain-containing protein [Chloroflexota bacterium]HUM68473.1 CHAD domain-containing protein [Chloroflexota bacterium]
MMKQLLCCLPDNVPITAETQIASGLFTLHPETIHHSHDAFYDSFDWRLYEQSLALISNKRTIYLADLAAAVDSPKAPLRQRPTFAWHLPEGEIRERIAPLLDVRALLPQAEIYTNRAPYRVLNDDEKTVARLVLETIRPSHANAPPLSTCARLLPLRGYETETEQVGQWLVEQGATAVTPLEWYERILTAVGKTPGDYTAKPRLTLDPAMPAPAALKQLLQAELEIIQTNAPYIPQDIDTEFLHDFRVALRRTRSAISQFKDVLPPDVVARFRADLKTIAQWTNDLRDLDVYLLAEPTYRAMLPDFLQDDMAPLYAYLRQKRKQALRTAVTALRSPTYTQIMADWETFLRTPDDDAAAIPILPLAQQRIYKRYRRIIKQGQKILISGNEAEMHALRIECKKLRYLLEFFTTLFPPEEMALLIGQLKTLQSNLGDINDLHVQEAYLLRLAEELPLPESRPALLAVGALVSHLHQERAQARERFSAAFTQFATPDNRRLFKQLFKMEER